MGLPPPRPLRDRPWTVAIHAAARENVVRRRSGCLLPQAPSPLPRADPWSGHGPDAINPQGVGLRGACRRFVFAFAVIAAHGPTRRAPVARGWSPLSTG